jgi:pyruvate/2-oxoglutarate dehydrogenase complex dihydrolipoamide acyltransferase (E2) component
LVAGASLITGQTDALAMGGGLEPAGREVLLVIDEYGSNLDADREMILSIRLLQEKSVAMTLLGDTGADFSQEEGELSLLSTDTVSQLTESSSPATFALGCEGRVATAAAGTVEASGIGDVEEVQRVDLLKDIPGAQRAKRTKTEAYSRRKPPAPASQVRKSSRINGEARELIMEKAQRLAAEKNLDKERGTDHVILDLHSDSHLSLVIRDSCVVFNPAAGTPGEILSMIRAKE